MKKTFLLLIVLLSVNFVVKAQNGTLSGVVIEEETGDPLIGANVYIPELEKGAVTDLDGKYFLDVKPGNYTVVYSFVTFQKKSISEVEVSSGKTNTIDVALASEDTELTEVTVSAKRMDNSEVAILQLQKKSLSVQDGISSQEMRKIGFTNSAESMKQVTGASVEGGKFIVMRGLGDRYSISTMDGVSLPNTDPYKNSAGLDLVPTSMVDNLVVKKTFTPDLPGNFTGGAVNITTKSLPDQYYFNLSVSAGINDQTTFNEGFQRDKIHGKMDWLGYDDGSRGVPSNYNNNPYLTDQLYMSRIRNGQLSAAEREEWSQTMKQLSDRSFEVENYAPPVNHSLNLTMGNRIAVGDNYLGYNIGVNYRRNFTQFDNRVLNNYTARIDPVNRMQAFMVNRGSESNEEINHGLIGTLAYQYRGNNNISLNLMYNNGTEKFVMDMTEGEFPGALSSGGSYKNRVVGFTQRNLFNTQLKGDHQLANTKITWSGNYILSGQYEPDLRFIASPINSRGEYFFVREVQQPFHFFRELNDTQYNLKLDLETDLSDKLDIKYGFFGSRKDREFFEQRFQVSDLSVPDDSDERYTSYREASGNFDAYFAPDNMGVLDVESDGTVVFGNTFVDNSRPENFYTGTEQVLAAYLMGVYKVSDKLKSVVGARVEKTDFEVVSAVRNAVPGTIDVLDVLPSLNLIYSLNDQSNLRASATQTLARPNMRELAPFASFDLLGGFPIVGNPDLERTNITNIDFRYEIFPSLGELFAVSAFYKNFQNPIVMELDVATDQPQYQYVNTNQGDIYGAEIEFRKNLGFISPLMDRFKFSTNFTYIYSRVDLSEQEYNSRKSINPDIESFRPFASQSPYIINAMLGYEDVERGWDVNVYANAFGPRLFANGSGAAPDIYEVYGRIKDTENNRITSAVPVPELNLKVQKQVTEKIALSLSARNLLDYSVVRYQEHNGVYYTTESFNPGRTYKFSLNYSIQ